MSMYRLIRSAEIVFGFHEMDWLTMLFTVTRWRERQERKSQGAMKAYSEYVRAVNGNWLVSNTYSIAYIAVGCAIGWVDFFEASQNGREQYLEFASWWEMLNTRENSQQTVPLMFDMRDKVI